LSKSHIFYIGDLFATEALNQHLKPGKQGKETFGLESKRKRSASEHSASSNDEIGDSELQRALSNLFIAHNFIFMGLIFYPLFLFALLNFQRESHMSRKQS